jgi:hypothetical protein
MCLVEPDVVEHRQKLLEVLLQGLAEGADVHDEGVQESEVLLAAIPADARALYWAGCFLLARAIQTRLPADFAAAEARLLEAERAQKGLASYELVTLYAQSGRPDEARKRLALARLSGVARAEQLPQLQADPLLAPLRELGWFQSYMQSLQDEEAFD